MAKPRAHAYLVVPLLALTLFLVGCPKRPATTGAVAPAPSAPQAAPAPMMPAPAPAPAPSCQHRQCGDGLNFPGQRLWPNSRSPDNRQNPFEIQDSR